jgi:hypothetical protein
MAPKKAASNVPATSQARTKRSDGYVDLSPLESRVETALFERHEGVLHLNYDIPPTVMMFYQAPDARLIDGGDITLFERMFLAGLRLPFPEIARDFVLFLMVTPSHIMPNAWRYLFASYILWRLVLKKKMKILQFFNIYRPRQTSEGMIVLCVRHPPIFIKLKSGLTNNKFWEQQFFRVSGEWECSEGTLLPENRRMPRTWQLLRPNRSETPSLSMSDQEDVKKISDWSAVRVKAEKFEEVDFDNLLTEENLRQFLGYNIPRDKRTITKRGAVKKRNDAPPSPRPFIKKRPSGRAKEIPEDVPLRKKQKIPLAASGVKRTLLRVSMAGTNTEEGSESFRGFVPEVSPTQEAGSTPPFILRDESGSEASYQGPDTPFEENHAGASTINSPAPERSKEGDEPKLEAHDVQVTRRVKHPTRKRKFSVQDRLVEIISEAERMWGKAVIRPSDVEEVRQESAPSGGESIEERDEDVGTFRDEASVEGFVEEGTPQTPSSERPKTPPPPSCDCEMGHETPQEPCTTPDPNEAQTGTTERGNTEEPETSQRAGVRDTPGVGLGEPEGSRVNAEATTPEADLHPEASARDRFHTEATTPEADLHPEASARDRSHTEASTSELRPSGSEAASSAETAPSVGPSSSSRVSAGFEVLGRGFLGHPMEAIKNLIPEGFIGNARVSSPNKIAQGILISHYQVSFREQAFI